MTEKEIRERSSAKVRQVMELALSLKVKPMAVERLDMTTGLIKREVHWNDTEDYPLEGEASGSKMQEISVAEAVGPNPDEHAAG